MGLGINMDLQRRKISHGFEVITQQKAFMITGLFVSLPIPC